jgi:diguanylate cyclase (GGDEF)-like protein
MALTKVEQDICQFVVHRLLGQGDVTRKQALLKKFKGSLSDALRKLVDRAVFRAVEQVYNQETYLPRAIAFDYCGDSEALAFAKKSTEVVLQVLLNLYEQELDKESKEQKQFTPSDVENEARNLKLDADQMMVRTGLYFAEELSVFWSMKKDANQVFIISFGIGGERIYEVMNDDSPWDRHIERGRTNVENHPFYDRPLDRIDVSGQPQRVAGLANKEKLIADVSSFLTRKAGIALLVIDLDHFKTVNDTKGHQEGDACLDRVVKTIGGVLGRKGILYRWGGDEFAVSLPDFSTEEAHATAERIRGAVEQAKPGADLPVTTSIGVSGSDQMTDRSAEDLLTAADKAMYKSKHSGKNRVTSWSATEFKKAEAEVEAKARIGKTAIFIADPPFDFRVGTKFKITPIVPRRHEQSDFLLRQIVGDCFQFEKMDSSRQVDIPKSFIEKVHKFGDTKPTHVQLSGRLQWLSVKRNFELFPPAGPLDAYGIGKDVDIAYEDKHPLGVGCRFVPQDRLPQLLEQGWYVFYDSDGMYLRWPGKDANQIVASIWVGYQDL